MFDEPALQEANRWRVVASVPIVELCNTCSNCQGKVGRLMEIKNRFGRIFCFLVHFLGNAWTSD